MHKRAFLVVALAAGLALAGCGGGGSSSSTVPGSNNGGQPTQNISPEDLFNLQGSDLLNDLELDAGFTATSSVGSNPQSRTMSVVRPQGSGPFVFQITGGNATVARSGKGSNPAVGFLMTYRDASGLCECSNDNPALSKPYVTNITNPSWMGGQKFTTAASTTTLGIGYRSNKDSADHGGTYTAAVNNPPGGTANFGPLGPATLPRQDSVTVSFAGNAANGCPAGSAYVSWNPVAGAVEFFVAFLTHFNNDPVHHPSFAVVGFVVTSKNYACVAPGNFYSKAQYQAILIDADQNYIDVYQSQGKVQAPKLPAQIDFSVSPITVFNTP